MGLGRAIAERRAAASAPAVQTRAAGANFQAIIDQFINTFGLTPTNSYMGGMSIPGAWRAAIILSDMLGGVPWDGYREIAGTTEVLSPKPLMLEQPNPPDTAMTTFSSWALDLIWNGNAIGLVAARNSQGWPIAFYAIPANMVGARRTGPNSGMAALPIGPIEYNIAGMTFGPEDILHIKGPCEPGALRGMGVLEAHLKTLSLASAQIDQAGSIAQHGVPSGLLKSTNPDLDQETADEMKRKWLAAQQTRTIAVLNATTEFEPLAWNPEEMELVASRQFTNSELSLIFGVPARRLNVVLSGGSDITYTNIEQEDIDLWRYSAGGHLARFEGALTLKMPRGTCAKANLDARLRPDTKTRYESHKIGIDAGFLLKSEARKLEDLPPIAGIDDEPEPPPPPPIQATAEVGRPAPQSAIEAAPADQEGEPA